MRDVNHGDVESPKLFNARLQQILPNWAQSLQEQKGLDTTSVFLHCMQKRAKIGKPVRFAPLNMFTCRTSSDHFKKNACFFIH